MTMTTVYDVLKIMYTYDVIWELCTLTIYFIGVGE